MWAPKLWVLLLGCWGLDQAAITRGVHHDPALTVIQGLDAGGCGCCISPQTWASHKQLPTKPAVRCRVEGIRKAALALVLRGGQEHSSDGSSIISSYGEVDDDKNDMEDEVGEMAFRDTRTQAEWDFFMKYGEMPAIVASRAAKEIAETGALSDPSPAHLAKIVRATEIEAGEIVSPFAASHPQRPDESGTAPSRQRARPEIDVSKSPLLGASSRASSQREGAAVLDVMSQDGEIGKNRGTRRRKRVIERAEGAQERRGGTAVQWDKWMSAANNGERDARMGGSSNKTVERMPPGGSPQIYPLTRGNGMRGGGTFTTRFQSRHAIQRASEETNSAKARHGGILKRLVHKSTRLLLGLKGYLGLGDIWHSGERARTDGWRDLSVAEAETVTNGESVETEGSKIGSHVRETDVRESFCKDRQNHLDHLEKVHYWLLINESRVEGSKPLVGFCGSQLTKPPASLQPSCESENEPSSFTKGMVGYSDTDREVAKSRDCANSIVRGSRASDSETDASSVEHGVDSHGEVRTVEGDVCLALIRSGAILQTNARSLRRIGLCRASRTDKGVHAACNALTVRLHLDAARDFCPLEEKENALCASPRALATWNSHLAPDVRIMGAVAVSKHCRARKACSLRSYAFVLPRRALSGRTVAELDQLLKKFVGTHNFVNFTGRNRIKTSTCGSPSQCNATKDQLSDAAVALAQADAVLQGAPRVPKDAMFVRTVYACSVDGAANIMPPGGAAPLEVVMVRIEGASFVYHQIRKIVGLCLAVLAGAAPPEVLDAALCGRTILQAPLAPGEGLVLIRTGFWDIRAERYTVSVPQELKTVSGGFLDKEILPHVARLFSPGESGDTSLNAFFEGLKVHFTAQLPKELPAAFLNSIPSLIEAIMRWRDARDSLREQRALETGKSFRLEMYGLERANRGNREGKRLRSRIPGANVQPSACGSLYPRGLMTEVCIHLSTVPGPLLTELRREVERAVRAGSLQPSASFQVPSAFSS